MSNKQLDKLCQKWQKILRLQDWKINIEFCNREDFSDLGTEGSCSVNDECKEAVIRIVKEESRLYNVFQKTTDTEALLIHEMLHIHIRHERTSVAEMEVAINMLTDAFLSFKG